jgi:N-acetylmuramic acid 6-phosphate etherase
MSEPLPDRGHLSTERRLPESASLDALDVQSALAVMNEQDFSAPRAVQAALPQLAKLVEQVVHSLRQGGRLIYLGAGTSGRLGVLDASECPPTFQCDPGQVVGIIAGGDGALRKSSEGAEDDWEGGHAALELLRVNERDTVVGIMAGGTTPYVWGALEFAGQRRCATGLICCVKIADVTLPRAVTVDHVIELITGPEVVTGSTRLKAGTATKLALNMISTVAMVQIGKVWGNLMVDVRASNAKLRDRAARIVAAQTGLSRDEAMAAVDRAGGSVKVALVMTLRQVDAATAKQMIDAAGGKLRAVLGAPR